MSTATKRYSDILVKLLDTAIICNIINTIKEKIGKSVSSIVELSIIIFLFEKSVILVTIYSNSQYKNLFEIKKIIIRGYPKSKIFVIVFIIPPAKFSIQYSERHIKDVMINALNSALNIFVL